MYFCTLIWCGASPYTVEISISRVMSAGLFSSAGKGRFPTQDGMAGTFDVLCTCLDIAFPLICMCSFHI